MLKVITTLAVLVATSTSQAKQLYEWWNESGLTLDIPRKLDYFKNTTCYRNAASFRGCVQMINAAGKSPETIRYKIIPTQLLGQPGFEMSTIVKTFGAFILVQYSAPKEISTDSVRESFKKEADKTKRLHEAYEVIRTAKPDPADAKATDLKKWRPTNFEALFDFIIAKVNTDPYKEGLLAAEMINAFMAETIDAHTYLVPINQFRESSSNADDAFYGLGCELQVTKGQLTVVSPLPQLPCEQAGIQTGDVIAEIDGSKTEGLSLSAAVAKIKSDKPDVVKLKILRGKAELPVKEITRSMVKLMNVHSELFNVDGLKVGYLRINKFQDDNICGSRGKQRIKNEIEKLQKENAQAYVVDLRGNPGGLVDVGACVAGIFVGNKSIIKQMHPKSGWLLKENFSEQEQLVPDHIPVGVIINGASASASEFVAGALQDLKRAWLVGERTFGKGTVQTLDPWGDQDNDPRVRRVVEKIASRVYKAETTARFHLPSGRTNQLYGITPDFEVPFKVDATDDERFVLREAEQTQKVYGALGNPWVQTRPESCKIANCLAAAGVGAKVPGVKTGMNDMINDYQFRSTVEVLRCAMVVDTLPKCAN